MARRAESMTEMFLLPRALGSKWGHWTAAAPHLTWHQINNRLSPAHVVLHMQGCCVGCMLLSSPVEVSWDLNVDRSYTVFRIQGRICRLNSCLFSTLCSFTPKLAFVTPDELRICLENVLTTVLMSYCGPHKHRYAVGMLSFFTKQAEYGYYMSPLTNTLFSSYHFFFVFLKALLLFDQPSSACFSPPLGRLSRV